METYRPESLPPKGIYNFRAVIGNMLGNNYYNHSTVIDIPEGEHCDQLRIPLCIIKHLFSSYSWSTKQARSI